MKRTKQQIHTYTRMAKGIIKSFGGVPDESTSSYEYSVQTKAGPLLISIGEDCCICTRFCLDAAMDLGLGDRLNVHSGKWNWMGGHDHVSDMADLQQFGLALRAIV